MPSLPYLVDVSIRHLNTWLNLSSSYYMTVLSLRGVSCEKASSLFLSDFLCLNFRARLPIESCLAALDGVDQEGGLGGWGGKLQADG